MIANDRRLCMMLQTGTGMNMGWRCWNEAGARKYRFDELTCWSTRANEAQIFFVDVSAENFSVVTREWSRGG